ncbi:hypothetical protein EBU91_04805 [bacterium]|nr:hypothetical protein [bacterium]
MDYSLILRDKFEEFRNEFSHFTPQEIMYSIIVVAFKDVKDFKKIDILHISDKDLYKAICKAQVYEKESQLFEEMDEESLEKFKTKIDK